MGGILTAIKRGFGIATKSLMLVTVLFLFNLVWNLASLPFAAAPGSPVSPQLSVAALIFSIIFILVSIFVQGGVLGLVRDAVKEGKMKLANLVNYGLKYYLRLFLLGAIIVLIVLVVALIATLLIAATAPLNNTLITAVAVTAAIAIAVVAGLLYFIPLALSPYALVCEEAGTIEAMKRSLAVGRNPFARVFLLILLFVVLILIALGIGFVVGFGVGMISAFIPVQAGKILMAVATSVINGYLGVVMTGSFMVFYLSIAGVKPAGEKVF